MKYVMAFALCLAMGTAVAGGEKERAERELKESLRKAEVESRRRFNDMGTGDALERYTTRSKERAKISKMKRNVERLSKEK
jgi:hypothetical protein